MAYDETFVLERVGPTFYGIYAEAGRLFGDDPAAVVWPSRTQYDIDQGMGQDAALAKHADECRIALGLMPAAPIAPSEPKPPEAGAGVIAGRLRAVNGHLENDAGAFTWHGISEFDLIHLARTGKRNAVIARLDAAAQYRRNVVRVFAMAYNLFELSLEDDGYWDAVDYVAREAAARGIYIEICLLPDAQLVYQGDGELADVDKCEEVVRAWIGRHGTNPVFVFQASNEPYKNGFESAVDDNLLDLGEVMADLLGHRDFSIGDAPDGDDADASQSTIDESVTIARHCNLIVLHGSRKGGAAPDGDRLRRWADHLEGFTDVMGEVRKVNAHAHGIHDEPMGHASQQWVPLPNGKTYEREYDPQAALAAAATAMVCRLGYTYHRIAAQDAGTPGLDLIRDYIVTWPNAPAFKYLNDSWGGSPTKGFSGWGKVRSMADGAEGHTVASGTSKGSITWANGYTPITPARYDGPNVQLWDSA